MLIKVTEKHIKEGYAHSSTMCPIANAIREATKKHVRVGVVPFTQHAFVSVMDEPRILLPEKLYNIIEKFDNTKIMEPFEFELNYDK